MGVPGAPTVCPVSEHELHTEGWPPEISHDHREYAPLLDPGKDRVNPSDDVFAHHAFSFVPGEVVAIQSQAPAFLCSIASRFVRLHMFVNACVRNRSNRPVSAGDRCNAFAFVAPATELCRRPFRYALAAAIGSGESQGAGVARGVGEGT